MYIYTHILVGGFNPSEKYESQLGLLSPIYGKIKKVPNHQPVYRYIYICQLGLLSLAGGEIHKISMFLYTLYICTHNKAL